MADRTGIEWTDASWNPVVGCSIVSPGCTNCYAMGQAARVVRCSAGLNRASTYDGTIATVKGKPVWTGKVALASEATLTQPLRWKRPRRIFVNSMGDLFHEGVPDVWIDRVFAVMALAPQHTFQILTKRSARMRAYLSDPRVVGRVARVLLDAVIEGSVPVADMAKPSWPVISIGADIDDPDDVALKAWPLPNVWLGVSAEDQRRADERIPDLLATPAAIRFVSAEPLLGPIDMKRWAPTGRWGKRPGGERAWFPDYYMTKCEHCGWAGSSECCGTDSFGDDSDVYCASCHGSIAGDGLPQLDWVIVGGESGKGARPMHPDWARAIRDQCAAAGTAFFFKQWGEWHADGQAFSGISNTGSAIAAKDGTTIRISGVDIPLDRFADTARGEVALWKVGKARAGRLLDGVTHDALPSCSGLSRASTSSTGEG